MPTNTLEAPRTVGGGTITVTTKNAYGYALAVTRRDRPERLLITGYLTGDVEPETLSPTARNLAQSREQSVHIFTLSPHSEHARWIGTFHADGSTTT